MLKDEIERKTKKNQCQPVVTIETPGHDHETRT